MGNPYLYDTLAAMEHVEDEDAQVQGMLGAMAVVTEHDAPELVRLLESQAVLTDARELAELEADTEAEGTLIPADNEYAAAHDSTLYHALLGVASAVVGGDEQQPVREKEAEVAGLRAAPRTAEGIIHACKGSAAECPLNVLRLVKPADVKLTPYPHLVRALLGMPSTFPTAATPDGRPGQRKATGAVSKGRSACHPRSFR